LPCGGLSGGLGSQVNVLSRQSWTAGLDNQRKERTEVILTLKVGIPPMTLREALSRREQWHQPTIQRRSAVARFFGPDPSKFGANRQGKPLGPG
jgi:hypothetical protein